MKFIISYFKRIICRFEDESRGWGDKQWGKIKASHEDDKVSSDEGKLKQTALHDIRHDKNVNIRCGLFFIYLSINIKINYQNYLVNI